MPEHAFHPASPLDPAAERLLQIALDEDIGAGDVTSAYFVDPAQTGVARIIAKETGVAAGVEVAARAFALVDARLRVTVRLASGARVEPGDAVLEVAGPVRSILTAERVALNFLQQLSGVATLTRRFVDAVNAVPSPPEEPGHRAQILDTRKTTPGLRLLEKAAVRAGGGTNHRVGLFDMALVKDNHLAARDDLAFLRGAIARLRTERPGVRVELEADTVEQVRGFLTLEGVAVILLDNMSPAQMRECVALGKAAQAKSGGTEGCNPRVLFEASGGVSLATVAGIVATGVDYISVGALTHSAPALDFSLDLQRAEGGE